jgi:hypothetical protein
MGNGPSNVANIVSHAADNVGNTLGGVANNVGSAVHDAGDLVGHKFEEVGHQIGLGAHKFQEGATRQANDFGKGLASIGRDPIGAARNVANTTADVAKFAFKVAKDASELQNSIQNVATDALLDPQEALNKASDAADSATNFVMKAAHDPQKAHREMMSTLDKVKLPALAEDAVGVAHEVRKVLNTENDMIKGAGEMLDGPGKAARDLLFFDPLKHAMEVTGTPGVEKVGMVQNMVTGFAEPETVGEAITSTTMFVTGGGAAVSTLGKLALGNTLINSALDQNEAWTAAEDLEDAKEAKKAQEAADQAADAAAAARAAAAEAEMMRMCREQQDRYGSAAPECVAKWPSLFNSQDDAPLPTSEAAPADPTFVPDVDTDDARAILELRQQEERKTEGARSHMYLVALALIGAAAAFAVR